MASTFGATTCIHVADGTIHDAVLQVRALCGGRGADYAFECTGVPQLAMAPLAFVRDAGTAVQVSANETTAMVDLRLLLVPGTVPAAMVILLHGVCGSH